MRLEPWFHRSFYVTLALAAACLALPSTYFLPWMPFFFGALVGLFYLAWRREGDWLLSETAANHLGVFIAIGAAGWILFQIPRSQDDLLAGGVNWPAGLLPHLGPLLMILLVVKLFRPKRLPDFWVIQTMGLMMVTLAAVLADDQSFGLFMVLYLASLVWCLTLYYPVRERLLLGRTTEVNHLPLFPRPAAGSPTLLPWFCLGLGRTALWTAMVVCLGFLLFLTAPRQGVSQWNARQLSTTSQVSFRTSFDASIDLNRTGRVELSEEPAFAVTVQDHQGRSVDPARIPRWRMDVLEVYSGGRWFPLVQTQELLRRPGAMPVLLPVKPMPAAWAEDQWLITVQIKPGVTGGFVLAEPLDIELGIGLGPTVDSKPHPLGFFALLEGCEALTTPSPGRRRTYAYGQLARTPLDDDEVPARLVHEEYAALLASQRAPRPLIPWTRDLLRRLPELNDADRQLDDNFRLPLEKHATVARALCRHLSMSGEYRYDLELRRKEREWDPTVDFLVNVKEGHCERYAGGLALMLRALGMRCRVVRGFLGAEMDEDGQGIVRLNQAHSWVQALVPGTEPGSWKWLMLDPTPPSATDGGGMVSWLRWWNDNVDMRSFWRQFILDYTPDQQAAVLDRFMRAFWSKTGLLTVLILGGALTLLLGARRLGRGLLGLARRWLPTAGTHSAGVAFFDELLQMLRRQGGLTPQPGQTPREFGAWAADLLAQNPAARDVAHIPERVIAHYYQARYGGRILPQAELREIAGLLAALRNRLDVVV
jgi:hypothetical protein